jgi:toxin ParE1/3/4
MSSRKSPSIKLSPKAQQDFIDILRYTAETWGESQLAVYAKKIDDALKAIGDNPKIGHQRDDLPPSHRAYLVGSHVIVYRTGSDNPAVVRILHQRMSAMKHV